MRRYIERRSQPVPRALAHARSLDLVEKALWRDGAAVPITPKAFDTLAILVERSGRLVEKDELMKRLWPDSFVEENSLSQNIYLVRKALGEESRGTRYIETAPRRGYRFTAPVKKSPGGDSTVGTHTLIEENEARPPAMPPSLLTPLSPPRRFSRTLLFALASALALLAVWLTWGAPRRSEAVFETLDDRKQLTRRFTENPEAYEAYARGLFFWNKRTEDGFRRSIEYFNQALAKDPHYALAWAGLADTYAVTGYLRYKLMPANDAYRKAEEAVTKALEIDQTMAEAYTALSIVRAYRDNDLPGAEKEIKKAIALLKKVREQQKGKAGVYYNALEALGHAYAVAGQRAAAERIIAELNDCPEDKDDTTYRQALIRAGLGELDQAFALLETNSDSWTSPPVGLMLDPRFDNLRVDPRYEALMKKKFGRPLN